MPYMQDRNQKPEPWTLPDRVGDVIINAEFYDTGGEVCDGRRVT